MGKKYKVRFISSGSNCESEIEIESIEDFTESLKGKEWLNIFGNPTLSIRIDNIESMQFDKIKY